MTTVDEGKVDTLAKAGSNVLDCKGKDWQPGMLGRRVCVVVVGDIHRFIVSCAGSALVIDGTWPKDVRAGSPYRIYSLGVSIFGDRETNAQVEETDLHLDANQEVVLKVGSRGKVEFYGEATVATTFHLDVSLDGATWIADWLGPWAGVTNTPVGSGYLNAFPHIRLRAAATGNPADRASLRITASP